MINENELIPYCESDLPEGSYLVFAPHPDDETLGMGGSIALAVKRGIRVDLVFMTNGEKGGDPDIRRVEAEKAAEILGINRVFYLSMGDRTVFYDELPESRIDEILGFTSPSAIFLPSFQEIHPDHRSTTSKILSFLNKIGSDHELWFYEINRQGECNRLIDISSVLDIKESAVECYASQLEQLDYKVHALCLNFMRSVTLGGRTSYVEGFWRHEPGCGRSPEENYFCNLFRYCSSGRASGLSNDPAGEERKDAMLRSLRDRTNNQSDTIVDCISHSEELAHFLNEKIERVRELEKICDENSEIMRELEKRISDIAVSRAHRVASAYVKSIMDLRLFWSGLKSGRSGRVEEKYDGNNSKKRWAMRRLFRRRKNAPGQPVDSSVNPFGVDSIGVDSAGVDSTRVDSIGVSSVEIFSGEEDKIKSSFAMESESESIAGCNGSSDPSTLNVTCSSAPHSSVPCTSDPDSSALCSSDIEDMVAPLMRLFSSGEIDSDSHVHDVYLESQTYISKSAVPVISNSRPLKFTIACDRPDLSRIDLFMATFRRVNPGTLILSIYEDSLSTVPIRTARRAAPAIMDNRFAPFDFDPLENSMNHTYYAELSLEDGIEERYPGLWVKNCLADDDIEKYRRWIDAKEKKISSENLPSDAHEESSGISILILMPLFFKPETAGAAVDSSSFISYCLDSAARSAASLSRQSHENWKMVILCSSEIHSYVASCENLTEIIGKNRNRISLEPVSGDHTISDVVMNSAEESACTLISFLEPGDILASNALEAYSGTFFKYPDTDAIYTDHDTISEDGVRSAPFFKPDFSRELLFSGINIFTPVFFNRSSVTDALASINSTTILENFSYSGLIRLTEKTCSVRHIPKILCHRVSFKKEEAHQDLEDRINGIIAKRRDVSKIILGDSLKRVGIEADIHDGLTSGSIRVRRAFDRSSMVSIIIPFRDTPDLLETSIRSIVEKTNYRNYEIIAVNNGSRKKETLDLIERLRAQKGADISVYDYDRPFNYAAINNFAARIAKGSHLLFLNSDTEVINGEWLDAMLEYACSDSVGAIGAKLYYINDTIQHAGVVLGIAGLAGHSFKHVDRYAVDFYHGLPCMAREVSAVTGACMMVKKELFQEIGGFDEELFKVSYNDLDLCLKIRQRGYSVIFTPFAELYHYESYSRGYYYDPSATENFRKKWGEMVGSDPFYNTNLTLSREDWSID